MSKPSLLLHCCCAPCTTVPYERLRAAFEVSLYYCNPNIYPESEYQKRYQEVEGYAHKYSIPLVEESGDIKTWYNEIRGLENEPEGGRRCAACFRLRLRKTANYAHGHNFKWFATTLTLSPHKNTELIHYLGLEIAKEEGVNFYTNSFKENNGFQESLKFSRAEGFYRQKYCGCQFSQVKV